ncbi:DUF488 family protein [Selenomonas noxia]|uniref:DUF488 domain-containing protein n=1 Tax=Selenomonas noxia TaxID=135083 RepID=UPI00288BDE8D|nr:DUF488 family protein [Selenomonas noxia]
MAEIRIKRIYEAPEAEDGFRVLIDRLWPRGISKERAALEDWWKDIAPSPELRTWFGHKAEKFAEFAEKYRAELSTGTAAPAHMKTVAARLAAGENVTLLYGAKEPKINQAVVLRDWMLHRMDK